MSASISNLTEGKQRPLALKFSVDKYFPGTWHGQDTGPLERALAHLADACPSLMPLARFILPRVPRALLCSNTLKTENPSSHTAILPRAVRRQWIGWQAPGGARVNALCIDCDKEGWREALRSLMERGAPAPAYVAVSKPRLTIDEAGNLVGRDHETAHLVWFLRVPVKRDNPVSYDLFKRTRAMLVSELGGDPAAANHLTKNPFHRAYATEAMRLEPVDLADLFKPLMEWCGEGEHVLPPPAVPREGKPRPRRATAARAPAQDLDEAEVRQWGKLFAARHAVMAEGVRDLPTITAILEEHAAAHCARPADHRARRILDQRIKDHAASIHHWMNTAWKGSKRPGIDHGVMTREAEARHGLAGWRELDWTSKRKLAAERTHAKQRERTADTVAAAAARMWADSRPITQAALAAAAGIDVRHVKRLWNERVTLEKGDIWSYQGFPPGRERDGGPVTPLTLRQISAASKERARAAQALAADEARAALAETRRVAGLVRQYEAHAVAMRERGAMPVPPPRLPMGTRGEGSPEVMAAYEAAKAATADARRRQEARSAKAQQQEKAKERRDRVRRWAEAGDMAAYDAFLAERRAWWDKLLEGRAGEVRTRMEAACRAVFARFGREWRKAVEGAGLPMPPRTRPRLRTKGDGLDRRAASIRIRTTPEEVTGRAVRERTRRRLPEPVGAGARDPAEMDLDARTRWAGHLTP